MDIDEIIKVTEKRRYRSDQDSRMLSILADEVVRLRGRLREYGIADTTPKPIDRRDLGDLALDAALELEEGGDAPSLRLFAEHLEKYNAIGGQMDIEVMEAFAEAMGYGKHTLYGELKCDLSKVAAELREPIADAGRRRQISDAILALRDGMRPNCPRSL